MLFRSHLLSKFLFATLFAVLLITCSDQKEALLVFAVENEKVELASSDIIYLQLSEPHGGNEWSVSFKMSKEKAVLFGKFTEKHVDRPMSISLCGKLIFAPVIREPIYGGAAMLPVGHDPAVAKQYERFLNSGRCK
jgi:preprotein translocase subunit SecD